MPARLVAAAALVAALALPASSQTLTNAAGHVITMPATPGTGGSGHVITVGPGGGFNFTTVAAAIAASANGDTIAVQTGTYTDDTATISTSIALTAVGGRVHMVATVALANQKGILIIGTASAAPTVSIDAFDFSGAQTPNGNNGAGVLYQNGNLTLTNDYFHDNEDGVRGGPQPGGVILIDHCEFNHNGNGDGLTHNIYIGDIATFTLQNSYSHDVVLGHEVKSRAETTNILNNRIFDNAGNASYSIDAPQGGNLTVSGNIIQQSAASDNPAIIAYSEEVNPYSGLVFNVTNNVFVNDLTGSQPIAVWNQSAAAGGAIASITNNQFFGVTSGQIASGTGGNTQSGSTFLGVRPTLDTTTHPYTPL